MYGQELVLDLVGCNKSRFNWYSIRDYFINICEIMGVERCGSAYWESEPGDSTTGNPKTHGITAVQALVASSVTLHALDLTRELFVNIFTCSELPIQEVKKYTLEWFGGSLRDNVIINRGADPIVFVTPHKPKTGEQ